MLPKSAATRSNLNAPTSNQFNAPTMTKAKAVLEIAFIPFS